MNEIKLEDEYEYIITLMRQDSSVESLREKLPQALEALDKIKQEYRRFYDESMEETRSFDTGMCLLLYNIEQVIFTRLDLGMVHMRQTHRRTHTLSPARFYHGLRQV